MGPSCQTSAASIAPWPLYNAHAFLTLRQECLNKTVSMDLRLRDERLQFNALHTDQTISYLAAIYSISLST